MKKLKGKLAISKVTCSDKDDYMIIQLEDNTSSLRVIEIEISITNMMQAITGLGGIDVIYEIRECLDKIGKKLEIKTELIKLPNNWHNDNDTQKQLAVQTAISIFEVDGWLGKNEDAYNHHNYKGIFDNYLSLYKVTFYRYVELEQSDIHDGD